MYIFLHMVGRCLAKLSDNGLGRFAGFLTWLAFDVFRFRRAVVIDNLRTAFPEWDDKRRIAVGRESVKNFLLTALELLEGCARDIAARVTIKGIDNLRQTLRPDQGLLVVCCHIGNWEAMGAATTRQVAPAHILVKRIGLAGVDRFVRETRARNGFIAVERKSKGDGSRTILKALQTGEIVGFVLDQARPGEPRLPFFGSPAKTNTSLGYFSLRYDAPVHLGFAHRTGPRQHMVEYGPRIPLPPPSGDEERDKIERTLLFNKVLETAIRRWPEHYFWLHRRWKS